jgi:hypothetical protein
MIDCVDKIGCCIECSQCKKTKSYGLNSVFKLYTHIDKILMFDLNHILGCI